jgi:hypothetical protein
LTPALKRRVEEKYRQFIDVYLDDVGDDARVVKEHFESVLTFMNAKKLNVLEEFRRVTQRLDELREENFHDMFPELGEMFQTSTNARRTWLRG